MPGLSQLQQFNKDLLSIGDEITVRAGRGEKPVTVPIPKEIQDINDSEDFVLGMPENEAAPEVSTVDEDLSDITSLVSPSSNKKEDSTPSPSFEAPDMSSILNPVVPSDGGIADMPDLSMFDEPVEETPAEPEPEPEPEQISVADMSLDALLAGAGFDEPEEPENPEPEQTDLGNDVPDFGGSDNFSTEMPDLGSTDNFGFDMPDLGGTDNFSSDMPDLGEAASLGSDIGDFGSGTSDAGEAFDFGEMPDLGAELPGAGDATDFGEMLDLGADLPGAGDATDFGEMPDLGGDLPGAGDATDFGDVPDFGADLPGGGDATDFGDVPDLGGDLPGAGDATDFGEMPDLGGDLPGGGDATDFGEMPDFGADLPGAGDATDFGDMPDLGGDLPGAGDATDFGDVPDLGGDLPETDSVEDFSADLPDLGDTSDLGAGIPDAGDSTDFGTDLPDLDSENLSGDVPEGLFNASDMEMADAGGITDALGSIDDAGSDEMPAADTQALDDFDTMSTEGLDDFDSTPNEPFEDVSEEIPDFEDAGDFNDSENLDSTDELGEVETFDTSEMEGMDFGIPETDAQLGNHDFELGQGDEFAMEGDFEIPGFSDVSDTAEVIPNQKAASNKKKNLDEPDFSKAIPSDDLPPNTLTDEQYQEFLKNLHNYPLNVRLAFEDLIVQDEFTDDAEFEVIEKILNKAPARSVASMLEKMLDISLPVPRDYENRTAEEYEAYKKSLSYQLRNKIIPGILIGVICLFVAWGVFNFTKNCIYKPLKAIKLYKQGYAMIEKDEYPQSEMKFNEATNYRYNKKWFFNYARAYREHKQFQRADKIYQNILLCFNHDKAAGLEYADMMLNDLANYDRAEEIVRREVLDYHINDESGILMLGDIFLEWGTEKDPAKLELAREQYATLLQLYGADNLYLSRMMRYFIRSDNLRQVLQSKGNFEGKGKEKSLSSEDWTELSGYLLNKAYGPLAPSEEYLRYQIEGLRKMLITAVKADPSNPIALYNLAKYYIQTNETNVIEPTLKNSIEMFNQAKSMKRRDIYKYIDAYRLLGEYYIKSEDYLQAQEQYAEGISLYTTERDNAGFTGNKDVGKLYEDLANLKYFISGDYDEALLNYKASVELENDSPSIRYRIGYIQYNNKNFVEALGSFMKAGDGNIKERNLMLAMANTLAIRGDDYAAEGYYAQLIHSLDEVIAEKGLVLPQANIKDYDIVNTYLTAANNYGVTLYRLAKRTGDSSKNGEAIVQFSQSVRAWDALTRNQETLVRLGGSNLAEQNIQYITHPIPDFEPTIYTEIQKTLTDKEKL